MRTSRILLIAILCLVSTISFSNVESNEPSFIESIDYGINSIVGPFSDAIVSIIFCSVELFGENVPLVVVWLMVGALVFTVYLKFINIRGFRLAIDIVRGKYTNPNDKGEVSHFQALTTALSATVGLGNIAGVAVAISIGGPGATFWMIIAGLLGMSSKFVECTLGVKYRVVKENGDVSGGPMYYLKRGFEKKGNGWAKIGYGLAIFFALMGILGSFGGGNMFQINQATQQFVNLPMFSSADFVTNSLLFGVVLAVIVGVVIIGGIKSIAKVTDKIVPVMCGIYCLTALVVLFSNFEEIPNAFAKIINGAFSAEGISGGVVGVLIQGFKRAAFSNEAGVGSAAIAHSAVKTKEPITEGLVSLLEPFIDTVIVCTMTALVIVITGVYDDQSGMSGIEMTSSAFESVFPWFKFILTLAVVMFAFSTMISWSYYGLKCVTFLFGDSKKVELGYKIIFCLIIVVGSVLSLDKVIGISDAAIFAMCIPNVLGMFVLLPEIKRDLDSFLSRIKSGEIKSYK
ncbi:MAG: alanine:cation symporter family protein [Flavobacteriales bacterium]|nr:alanine:cation symporter family protein [Flavobacteriales bacterium]